jgi:hypothetical protein
MIVRDGHDVGAAPALDRGRDARLDVVLIDALGDDLDAGLLAELLRLLIEELIRRGDEVGPLKDVEPRPLREGGRLTHGEHRGECGAAGDETSTVHGGSSCLHMSNMLWGRRPWRTRSEHPLTLHRTACR